MQTFGIATLSIGFLVLVTACAPPAPEPILPEPVFDKYGNEIISGGGQVCRDGSDQGQSTRSPTHVASPNRPGGLPICDGSCPGGQVRSQDRMYCVPTGDGGDDSDRPNQGGNQTRN